jgi:SAM-dependent methyltransferase
VGQFEEYSAYYDLLYKDKDYMGEVLYIDHLIRKYGMKNCDLLDIGCGTGKHANLLIDKGYCVSGIDKSDRMIEIAQKNYGHRVSFSIGDIRNFDLNKSFDVITSLFHVMSYQTTNEDVDNVFRSVNKHLKKGGYFIFDCWHGPGIINDPPVVKVKRMENSEFEVIRISEPICKYNESVIEVNFTTLIRNLKTENFKTVFETHKMRFFFKNEIELFASIHGLELTGFYSWLSFNAPKGKEWYSVFVLKK